ncbi:Actin-binding LIM protein 2 [Amphibalanus amphitrite]|uniref:Actin-binding LIM protein 2 n=1 Tax=Amphibalanus amphitrite TaxID=1232801 RepID=A0A6A4WC34_AMPAM|nr:Actin-binding LIM protein 2 [Amphibalanus amphitrite]KAF0299610.1 Actin-binding LIM protein 2 [Amphibalanus amphitrite]
MAAHLAALSAHAPAPLQAFSVNTELPGGEMGETGAASSGKKKGKQLCGTCNKKCSGEVLKVHEKFFHINCFKCKACNKSLAQGGFFSKNGEYFCSEDYQRRHGTKCAVCGQYVEGEVVTALGNTYHQKCFLCARCRQPFPSGERVTFTGKECLCSKCVHIPVVDTVSPQRSPSREPGSRSGVPKCSGCQQDLTESQALIALDKPWHIWCFKCTTCQALLHGEYMTRDGKPFCEKHYQAEYGVKCAYCQRYISGKVLQAGDNHHFHPTCARCTKCGDPFGDGEEMYLQGAAIWHPRCGPGPTENGVIINGQHDGDESAADRSAELDRLSTTASETQYSGYRSASPGLLLREYRSNMTTPVDVTRIYTQSYLADGPTMGYLRRPIEPYDKPPKSPHFHRPPSGAGSSGRRMVFGRPGSRSGMQALVNQMESETPRPRSPYMNNEEPIELSHYPDAKKPSANEQAKIERDDFPAPSYPYTDPERRRRLSDKSSLHEADLDELDAANEADQQVDPKLKREEAELNKIASGIGKVFLEQVREREKLQQWKRANVDPRNASRAPNADHELPYRMRYESPIYACHRRLWLVWRPGRPADRPTVVPVTHFWSRPCPDPPPLALLSSLRQTAPSRDADHVRPWELEEEFERGGPYRSSLPGRAYGAVPNYRSRFTCTAAVPSLRYSHALVDVGSAARLRDEVQHAAVRGYPPGYQWRLLSPVSAQQTPRAGGLQTRSQTLLGRPGIGLAGGGDFYGGGLGEKTHSTEFCSARSDISIGSLTEADRNALNQAESVSVHTPRSGHRLPYQYQFAGGPMRRSLPNVSQTGPPLEPGKVYPLHLLVTTNYRLPADVDRANLERHLSDAEFEMFFHMSRADFYRLPLWRRNDLKKRGRLF